MCLLLLFSGSVPVNSEAGAESPWGCWSEEGGRRWDRACWWLNTHSENSAARTRLFQRKGPYIIFSLFCIPLSLH